MEFARVLVTHDFMALPGWFDLYIDFYNCKLCGVHPAHWGRDSTLWQKPLAHIQLTDSPVILERWSKISSTFHRTVKESEADHDLWLLYAFDNVDNSYLMLDVFGPNAHKSPDFGGYVRTLLQETVHPWIDGDLEVFEPPEDYEP